MGLPECVAGRCRSPHAGRGGGGLVAESGDCVFAPQQVFSVKLKTDDAEIRLSLYCAAADYFHKKYGMSATHSAVAAARDTVPAGRALDMG